MPIPSLKTVHPHKKAAGKDEKKPHPSAEKPHHPHKKKTRGVKLWFKRLAKIAVFAGVAGVFAFAAALAWFSRDLPDTEKLLQRNLAQSTKIYDRTGEHLLYEIHGDEKRTVIELDDISQDAIEATLASEDQKFYQHHGFDVKGITRSALSNFFGGGRAGGSTITQQFVKNSILTPEKTYTRKIKELAISWRLESRYSKDEILKFYLNEIPYGRNAYGIESAAFTYFNKSAKDLTLAESATLSSMLPAPTYYFNNVSDLTTRRNAVLNEMVDLGYATPEEAQQAKDLVITFQPPRENITAPHFVFYVREQLEELFGDQLVEQGGLKVITSIDLPKQKIAEEAVAENIAKVEARGGDNASLVSIDTKTKQIVAMVGSRDFFDADHDGQVNIATTLQQPGSSLKPFVYLTAFSLGYPPETILFDLVTDFPTASGNYTPHNYNGGERGPLSMRRALQGSLNIPAVKTLYLVGFEKMYNTLEAFGYTTFAGRPENLSLVLGGSDVKLLEHTYAYSSLAREGVSHPLTSVLKVTDKDGKTLLEWKETDGERIFDKNAVRILNNVLTDDAARSYVFGRGSLLTLPDRPVAVKTGTTQDYRDAWTVGYTPSIAAGVWVGTTDNTEMNRGADGSIIAAPIWNTYMKKVLTGTPVETFNAPEIPKVDKPLLNGQIDELSVHTVDRVTGKIIPDACLDTYPAEFKEERQFKETHTLLHYVDKSDPSGAVPTNPETDPMYKAWEDKVQRWARGQKGYLVNALEFADCSLRSTENLPTVSVTSPANGSTQTPASFAITASITPGTNRTLTKVVYQIDNVTIDTETTAPFTTDYQPTNLTFGAHTLTVTATNDLSNTGTASTTFTYAEGGNDASQALLFMSPTHNEQLYLYQEPFTVQLSVTDETVIQTLEVFERSVGQNGSVFATLTAPISKTPTVSWTPTSTGTYDLYFNVHTSSGIQTSDRITVDVSQGLR